MRVRTIALILAGAVAVGGGLAAAIAHNSSSSTASPAAGTPGWADVAPIFAAKCAGCHRLGGIAPFPITSARSAAAHAPAILTMTQLGVMPPWPPGADSPPFLGASRRILTAREKKLIAGWARGGAPIGAGGSISPPPVRSSAPGRTISLAPARSYMPHAAVGGFDDYHCFVLEPHLKHDVFVTSASIRPGQSSLVHHVILFEAAGANATEARHLNAASHGR